MEQIGQPQAARVAGEYQDDTNQSSTTHHLNQKNIKNKTPYYV
jgi:hypothetical protein